MSLFKRLTALFTAVILCALIGHGGNNGNGIYQNIVRKHESNKNVAVKNYSPVREQLSNNDNSNNLEMNVFADGSNMGDVNLSGYVTSADFNIAINYLSGLTPLTNEQRLKLDTSSDGTIDSTDILIIKQQLLGIVTKINNIDLIISDMKLPHESQPHGVPHYYDWAKAPREGLGVNMPKDWTATIAWGQVYEAAEGNPATNTRVQLRNMEMYYYSKSQKKWILLQSCETVTGNAYAEDFKGDTSTTEDTRSESNNGGGISVTAGNGYNYHFWPDTGSRATIDPNDIAVIYSTCQARLIVDDKNKPDDRDSARYLLSIGGDYWYNKTIGWADFATNGDWAIGRFRYVKKEWQAFNGWAGDENILRNNPPPMM